MVLTPDADMLNGARSDRVGDAGEGARGVVLAVAEVPGRRQGVAALVGGLEVPLREAEAAELDGHAGPDAQERRQRPLVEGQRALLRVDGLGGVERRRVRRPGLQAHFYYVEGLAWIRGHELVSNLGCS